MRYLGGKSRTRKQIAAFLRSVRKPGQVYFEPFVGGAWVLQEMEDPRVASDGNPALIAMYKALQGGWVPPDWVTEEEWRKHREAPVTEDKMQAFARIGCGFGGDWNGGYARCDSKSCYAATSKRSLLKQLPLIVGVDFECRLFQGWHPEGMLVYADPPYTGTTAYGAFDGFDHDLFWRTMTNWTEHNTVVVSEYQAPVGWRCVREFQSQMGLSSGDAKTRTKRTERLFMHESQVTLEIENGAPTKSDRWMAALGAQDQIGEEVCTRLVEVDANKSATNLDIQTDRVYTELGTEGA